MVVLTQHFAADSLPAARTAIANRIMAELKSIKRLSGDMLLEEIAVMRRIANKLVLGQGKYLSHEDLIAAFTMRSRRLVTYEGLARFLDPIAAPDEKIEKLLTIEESIIGAENKRQLANVIPPLITAASFTNHFQDPATPVLARLQRIAELQARVLRSGLQDNKTPGNRRPRSTRSRLRNRSPRAHSRNHRGQAFKPCRQGGDRAAAVHRGNLDRRRALHKGAAA